MEDQGSIAELSATPLSPSSALRNAAPSARRRGARWIRRQLNSTNSELLILLSLFSLAGLLTIATAADRAVLSLFILPTVASAYRYGRRHAVLTAFGSVLLVYLLALATRGNGAGFVISTTSIILMLELASWAGTLMVTAYLMGTLYEHRAAQLTELTDTYNGVLVILRHFLSNDAYTENHCYRVSLYAARIAAEVGLSATEIEDIRAAALLHDIGKLRVSRQVLHKAAELTQDEFEQMKHHVEHAANLLEPAGGALRRVLPLVLAHHDRFDGTGHHDKAGEHIPLGARVIAVADVYDSLVSDRPYRKAMTTFEAREVIEKASNTEFDPTVVAAFSRLFRRQELELSLATA